MKLVLLFKAEIETVLKDYIIKEKNLKEALANIMPSYWTIYECDNFTLRDGFSLGHNHTEDTMNLLIDCREHPLGSIIKITINYQGRKDVFEVPLLKDPTLSYNKLLDFRYDTQLLIEGQNLDEDVINDYITEHFNGDCLLAVGDDELIKIHFHTNEPWKVLEYCASLGEIYDIVVEDMERQSRGLKG